MCSAEKNFDLFASPCLPFIYRLKGNVEDITIKHISKFIVDKEKFTDLGNLNFKLDLNLTFPYIKVNGTYKINGTVGQAFMIYGNGPFR